MYGKNSGQLAQYYVEKSHEGIITKENWEQVQTELLRRQKIGASYSSINIFASKLICADCGGFYGSKKWHSSTAFAKEIYQCNRKFAKEKEKYQTPNLTEEQVKEMFIRAYNEVMIDKKLVLEDIDDLIKLLIDTKEIDSKILELNDELDVVGGLINKMVQENLRHIQNQEQYQKYCELCKRFEIIEEKHDTAIKEKVYKLGQTPKLTAFKANVENSAAVLTSWSNDLWMLMVEAGIVNRDGSITFKFYNGNKINISK